MAPRPDAVLAVIAPGLFGEQRLADDGGLLGCGQAVEVDVQLLDRLALRCGGDRGRQRDGPDGCVPPGVQELAATH